MVLSVISLAPPLTSRLKVVFELGAGNRVVEMVTRWLLLMITGAPEVGTVPLNHVDPKSQSPELALVNVLTITKAAEAPAV